MRPVSGNSSDRAQFRKDSRFTTQAGMVTDWSYRTIVLILMASSSWRRLADNISQAQPASEARGAHCWPSLVCAFSSLFASLLDNIHVLPRQVANAVEVAVGDGLG